MASSTETVGLYNKYIVARTDGQKNDPKSRFFVLDPGVDPNALAAVLNYADYCEDANPELAYDVREMVKEIRHRDL